MTLDLTLSSAIFADVTEHSHFKAENEVLFSMHTVFRIEEVVEFEVRLTLTREHGAEWIRLTDQIEENIRTGSGWVRLAQMLSKVGRVNEVEELFLVLLQHQPNEPEKGRYYNGLALIKDTQGAYKEAVRYHDLAISIKQTITGWPFPTTKPFQSSRKRFPLIIHH